MTIPKGWLAGPTEKLKHFFVDQFNKKHTDALPLNKVDCRVEDRKQNHVDDQVELQSWIKEGDEVFVRRGKEAPVKKSAVLAVVKTEDVNEPGSVMCKRFGCGKRFVPGKEGNKCVHHKKPPVFHETRKWWACCPDKVAWDWDSFQEIKGCESSEDHTDVSETKTRVLGGTDVRLEKNGPQEIFSEKKITSLDKLMTLRAAMIAIGVKGDLFDAAQNYVKRIHEEAEGDKIWDKVCVEMTTAFEKALENAHS